MYHKHSRLSLALGLAFAFVLILSSVGSASANVRLEAGGNVPFYARFGNNDIYHNSEWVVIIFYRPPECIPTDFNLLGFFGAPDAFTCGPYTTDGFIIWKNGPTDPAPIQSKLFGLGAVPVWFVPWSKVESAISDGKVYMGDLEAMSPLIGTASYYQETLHPSGGKHPVVIEGVARGILADGRTFDVNFNGTNSKDVPDIRIVIK